MVSMPSSIQCRNPIGCRWIFPVKRHSDGAPARFKARLVVSEAWRSTISTAPFFSKPPSAPFSLTQLQIPGKFGSAPARHFSVAVSQTKPPGDGFAEGRIDLGGLEVRQVSSFAKTWSTRQGGRDDRGATFYDPSPVPAGFSMLGSYAQPNEAAPVGWVLVGRDVDGSGSLAEPEGYDLVWSSSSEETQQDGGYFWLPRAPPGYRAVGLVVTASPETPSPEHVRCVREDLTDESAGEEESLWATDGFEVRDLQPLRRDVQARGVRVGTFTGNVTSNSNPPLSCLKNSSRTAHQSMPNLEQIKSLAAQYGPLIYFHPDETHLCSSVDFFFSNGALLYSRASPDAPSRIDPDGSNLPQGGADDGAFWLDLPTDDQARNKVMGGELESSKVYVHAKPMLGGTFTDLAFWVFYPFNGPATAKVMVLRRLPLGRIGEHVGDWEHITLRISNFTGELWRVYFSQHAGGVWKDAPELEFQNGTNKPTAYSSLNGHAFYPEPGLVLQGNKVVGIRNDTARGKHLDAGEKFTVVAADHLGSDVTEPPWLNYRRKWGPKITYDVAKELRNLTRFLPGEWKTELENALPSELLGEEGPSGPKQKANWDGDEKV